VLRHVILQSQQDSLDGGSGKRPVSLVPGQHLKRLPANKDVKNGFWNSHSHCLKRQGMRVPQFAPLLKSASHCQCIFHISTHCNGVARTCEISGYRKQFQTLILNVKISIIRPCYPWKAKINLNYVQRLCSYRAVNTLHLGYKNKTVNTWQVQGNNLCLFWYLREHVSALSGRNVRLSNVKPGSISSNRWALNG
jgi:hypothetical protein